MVIIRTDMEKTSKINQKEVLFSINCSKTGGARHARHIGYDVVSGHNSGTDSLPPTKNPGGMAPPPCSVPPIVRRANLMLDTLPVLRIVSGVFAVFLRDNIKRVTISGMMLPR